MQISAELSNFVREALNIGRRPETIHADLGASGWTELEIEAALAHWAYVCLLYNSDAADDWRSVSLGWPRKR